MNSSNTSRPKPQTLWQNLPSLRKRQLVAILAQWALRQRTTFVPTRNPSTFLSKGERSDEPNQS